MSISLQRKKSFIRLFIESITLTCQKEIAFEGAISLSQLSNELKLTLNFLLFFLRVIPQEFLISKQ